MRFESARGIQVLGLAIKKLLNMSTDIGITSPSVAITRERK